MSARPRALVLAHRWHRTSSDAFRDLVTSVLEPSVELLEDTWPLTAPVPAGVGAVICCQLLPAFDWIARQSARVVWVPMWDDVSGHSPAWWRALPRSLAVVAFSRAVAARARAVGLETLELGYFKDPAAFEPASWNGERTLLYWNRRGMIGPAFLSRLCAALRIDRVLFKGDLDPAVSPVVSYVPSDHIGRATVQRLARSASRHEYLSLVRSANVVVAPRLEEGVGMILLEGLVRGCAVFGADAPTMNEYIVHRETGYLFRPRSIPLRAGRAARQRLAALGVMRPPEPYGLSVHQPWREIGGLDLPALGSAARAAHVKGYETWTRSWSRYLEFVLHGH